MLNNEAISALKDTIDALNLLLEQKERRVRTPEGQRRFGQPIGTVIIADGIGSVSAPEAELAADLVDDAFDAIDKEVGPREVSAADNESAWYAVMTDEALSIFDRRAAHPERYNPSGQPGYGLRDGETELRVIRQPGPPRVADYETHTSAGLTMSEAIEVEGFIGMGASGYGKPLVPVGDPRPPKHVYRVMSVGEWEQAKERGYFKSDERMNLATDEGTVASLTTTGSFYVPPDGSDYRIVRLNYEDSDGWIRDEADGYIKTPSKIPFERVDLVTAPLKNPRSKDEPVEEALPGMDDPYLIEQTFEDDGQGVLPGMPEPIKRDLIKIVGTGADTDIDYSAFSDVVTPYKPKPISIRSVVRREEREQSLLEIQELDPDAQAYETDTQENGGLFANALSRHSSPFSTSEAKGLVKISVNEQITRRILDHAAANPDFMAWLDNYGYKSMYLGAMRGYNGTTIRYHVPELIPYYENLTQEEWNAQSAGRDPEKLFWMPGRVNDEEQEYLMIDLGKVPVEIQKKIAKITMLSAALEGSKDPSTGGAINPRTIDYIEKVADSFPYSEVVARFLTRKVIDKWAMTSGDHDRDAVLLQQIAMAKFGLEDVSTDYHLGSYDPVKYKELGLFYEVFVDAMYENTQEFFRENGIKYVNAYRGMKWEPDQVPNWATGGQNIDIEERVNERLEDAIEYYVEEYMSDNESEINDEIQQELDSDFDDFWRGREDEFWEDADFDLEDASELDKDLYRDEKRQEYYEQYWDAVRSRVLESWEENGRQLFYDQGGDAEVRADVMSEFADEMRPTGTIKVESQPLSSWSTNESTAGDFSSESGFYGLVVSGRIPVERIFCTTLTGLGCLNEAELVVLGDYDELTVE